MGLFSSRKREQSDFVQRLCNLEAELSMIKVKFEALETKQNSLRGLVNKKLNGDDKKEDLNSPDGLDELR